MKKKDYIIIIAVFVAGILLWAYPLRNFLLDNAVLCDKVTAVCSSFGLLLQIIAAWIALNKYCEYLKEKRNNALCEYCKRFTSEPHVSKVVKWIINTAKTDENGKIVGKNLEIERANTDPDVCDKEMFMRFFEELNIQINSGLINQQDALNLFAHYALVFDEYKSFRTDITDYEDENTWYYYHDFIHKIKQAQTLNAAYNFTKKKVKRQLLS